MHSEHRQKVLVIGAVACFLTATNEARGQDFPSLSQGTGRESVFDQLTGLYCVAHPQHPLPDNISEELEVDLLTRLVRPDGSFFDFEYDTAEVDVSGGGQSPIDGAESAFLSGLGDSIRGRLSSYPE